MRLALLVLLGAALAACATTRSDLPAQYAAAPVAAVSPGRADWEIVETDDAGAERILEAVAEAFARHDWRALAYTLDKADYAQQFGFMRQGGRSAEAAVARVLEETFGLGTVGNLVFPAGLEREAQPFAGLNRIRAVTLERAEPVGEGRWQVEGRVRLDDRTSRRLLFDVVRTGETYRVIVPQG